MAVAERILHLHRLEDLRPDDILIRAAQEGEREAASILVERYYPRVRSFVSYLTSGRSNAEDLTQEVFTRALTALGRFNGNYRFEPWLLRIAKNLVIDEARRRTHQPEPTDPVDLPEIEPAPISLDNVWDSIAQQMSSSTVNAALERLPLRQRTVLVLREIEEMAYADIAQVVGTNVRGVEATLRRARARFRIEVANLESDEAHAAICRRTLRLIASDGVQMSDEASQHLARCPECRTKASAARRADRLFGMLPPVAVSVPAWRAKVVASLPARIAGNRGLATLVRSGVTQLSAPIVQILEVAATVVIAAAVSTAAVTAPKESVRVSGAAASASEQQGIRVAGDAQPAADTDNHSGEGASGRPFRQAAPATVPTGAETVLPAQDQLGLNGLLENDLLPSVGELLSDPVGTVTGLITSVPETVQAVLDTVTDTVESTLGDPLAVLDETLDTVTDAATVLDQATEQLPLDSPTSAVPQTKKVLSRLGG